eukprot:GHRR01029171.1.p2 GENE.GHRR01029171.1~~GHRR01029171.1.p2  ORF type:complete len:117 (-),score=21.75 GHRR01029171.1:542-892(-)
MQRAAAAPMRPKPLMRAFTCDVHPSPLYILATVALQSIGQGHFMLCQACQLVRPATWPIAMLNVTMFWGLCNDGHGMNYQTPADMSSSGCCLFLLSAAAARKMSLPFVVLPALPWF